MLETQDTVERRAAGGGRRAFHGSPNTLPVSKRSYTSSWPLLASLWGCRWVTDPEHGPELWS